MNPLEEQRSLSLNGLLGHCCKRNGTMFCLRENSLALENKTGA